MKNLASLSGIQLLAVAVLQPNKRLNVRRVLDLRAKGVGIPTSKRQKAA